MLDAERGRNSEELDGDEKADSATRAGGQSSGGTQEGCNMMRGELRMEPPEVQTAAVQEDSAARHLDDRVAHGLDEQLRRDRLLQEGMVQASGSAGERGVPRVAGHPHKR
jgi:hypothetical protein